jgi:NADH:ubiquinone oxidoreductase subunit 3 (subunit A)
MEFTPVFLFILVAILTALGMLGSALIGPRRATRVKQMPYESGMDPIGDARQRFDVRYYLVAIMFLLFDVELLYLYPWAVAQYSVGAAPAVAGGDGPEAAARHGPRRRRGRRGADDRRHPDRLPQPGLLRNPGVHRRADGGVRLRLAQGGLHMALDIRPGPGTSPPSGAILTGVPPAEAGRPESPRTRS